MSSKAREPQPFEAMEAVDDYSNDLMEKRLQEGHSSQSPIVVDWSHEELIKLKRKYASFPK
jgi:hypothetical protein